MAGEGVLVTGKGYPDLATSRFLTAVGKMMPGLPMYALVDFDPDGIAIMRMYRHGSRNLSHEHVAVGNVEWLGVKSEHIMTTAVGVGRRSIDIPSPTRVAVTYGRGRIRGRRGSRSVPGLESWTEESSLTPPSQDSDIAVPPLPRRLAGSTGYDDDQPVQAQGERRRKVEDAILTLTPRDRKKAATMLGELGAGQDGDVHDPRTMECVRELQVMMMLNMKAEIQAVDRMGDMTDWLDEHLAREQ